MGDYIVQADIERRLRDHFDSLYDLPTDADDLDQDITSVEAEANAFLGRRYQVPVTATQAVRYVKKICLDLAEETAYARGESPELPEKIKRQADNARKQLTMIAEGKISLGAASVPERQNGGAAAIIVDADDPEFTRDRMKGF